MNSMARVVLPSGNTMIINVCHRKAGKAGEARVCVT